MGAQKGLYIINILDYWQKCKVVSIYENQSMWYIILTEKEKIIILIEVETGYDKIQHVFIITTFNKQGLEENIFSPKKDIYKNPGLIF